MSSSVTVTHPPEIWITMTVCYLILSVLHFTLLHTEIKQRLKPTTVFTTSYFKVFSMSCMIVGFLQAVFYSLEYIYGFCLFSGYMGFLFAVVQPFCMGYYQLSRLYYCSSNAQIHSNKGYPKWLFIIMYSFGIIIVINSTFSLLLNEAITSIHSKCIFRNYQWYRYPINIAINDPQTSIIWFWISSAMYLLWDLSTLFMYF